jgi:hypothetical protein
MPAQPLAINLGIHLIHNLVGSVISLSPGMKNDTTNTTKIRLGAVRGYQLGPSSPSSTDTSTPISINTIDAGPIHSNARWLSLPW